jgi:membrane protease YdiL (CAAX protease family)
MILKISAACANSRGCKGGPDACLVFPAAIYVLTANRIHQVGIMKTPSFHPLLILLALLAGAVAILVAFSGDPGSEIGLFFSTGAEVAPIFLIALLAHLAYIRPRLRPFVALLTVVLLLALGALSWVLSLAPWITVVETDDLPLEMAMTLFVSLVLCMGAVFTCTLGFSSRIRRYISSYLPIDPENFVHTVGLVTVAGLALMPLIPLLVLGHAPLADLMADPDFALAALTPAEAAKTDFYGLLWMVVGSFIAVGFLVRRTLSDVLERLGVVVPTPKQVFFALGTGLLLVLMFTLIDHAILSVWNYFGWTVTDQHYMQALFSSYLTPVAAVMAAIVAGVGEELAIRGVLQPRFGIPLSVMVFASLHAYQYAWDGVLSVFLAGLVFALLRERTNTSVCAITHATYDLVLFALLMTGIGWV